MHHHRVGRGLIPARAKPCETLLKGDMLRDREGPLDGIQLGVSINPTVEPEVSPEDRIRVRGQLPFLLLLQELKSGRVSLLHRGCADAALSCQDAAVRLNLGGVRTVIHSELVSVLDGTISIEEGVGVNGGAYWNEAEQTEHG